jgi:Clp amino terminal domain, pathogenicity island component
VATLHVRNVPDQLYEMLRLRAELEGRSIGAQAVAMLKRGLEDEASLRRRVQSRFSRLGPLRFMKDARLAVVAAQDEARELRHEEIATEHLLLGLMKSPLGAAVWALESPPLAITADAVRARVFELRAPGEGVPRAQLPFTAGAKQALEQALREALAMKDRCIEAQHVLLGIAAVEADLGSQVLRDLGADPDTLRAALLQKLASAQPPIFVGPPPWESDRELEYQAVALMGSAEEWTSTLNGLAEEGWELVSIVSEGAEPRAVFRRPGSETE